MRQISEDLAEKLKQQSNIEWFKLRLKQKPNALVGIAEGDSWFDYPPAYIDAPDLGGDPRLGDLINQLNKFSNLNLLRISKAGDTLENMTFGTEPMGKFKSKSPQLDQTIEHIRNFQPDFFVFSGGGNDVAGPKGLNFEPFLNHSKLESNLLRQEYFDYITQKYFPAMFSYLIARIKTVKPNIKIFLHGYGYPIPDGRAVLNIANFEFVGPWFEPALTRKNISQDDGQVIVYQLIDALNTTLSTLEKQNPGLVYFIDLRSVISKSDWINELHLSAKGYQKVAVEFDRVINAAFGRSSSFNLAQEIAI